MRRRVPRLLLAALIGLLLFLAFPHPGRPAVAAPRASGQIVANDVVQDAPARSGGSLDRSLAAPAGAGTGSTGEPTLVHTSPVLAAGALFDRVGLRWTTTSPLVGETLFVELRTSADGVTFSDWQAMPHAHDLDDDAAATYYAPPRPAVEGARYAQYRIWLTGGDADAVARVGVTFLDVSDLSAHPIARLANDLRGALADLGRSYAQAAPVGAPRILTRQDWAADEALMKWTPRYQSVQKVVVHHTVTADGGTNVAAEIRSIYYFHAVTRGWGDLGYNYLVDKSGNIWTGRQGGEHAIGGHAYGWNSGTMGIAAIGDYTARPPTGQLQGAIANIIALRFAQYDLQPLGNGVFTHEEQQRDGRWTKVTATAPNVLGHRDANSVAGQAGGQTACPGNTVASMLDGLRRLAQDAATNGYSRLARLDPALPSATYPGGSVQVPVTVANKGREPIPAGTSVGYRLLRNGAVVSTNLGVALAAPLAPGAATTVTVPLSGPANGEYVVRWDLATAGSWWSALHNAPFRDVWLRSADWSADWVADNVPNSFVVGETRLITALLTNDGGRTWNASGANPVRLTYTWTSRATGNAFPGANKQPLPQDVPSGASVTVTIPVTAPAYPTNYTLRLDLEKENEFRFGDRGVAPDDTSIAVLLDYQATYAPAAVPFTAGVAATVPVTVTNTGKGTFPTTSAFPVALGYHWYDAAGRVVVWDGARTRLPADLPAGRSVTVQATVTPPTVAGTYQLRFDLMHEGQAWFSEKGAATGNLGVTVTAPVVRAYGATYQPGVTTLAQSGALASVPITVTNTGNFAWPAAGPNPVTLSYHWFDGTGRVVVWDGARARLAADIAPASRATLSAPVQVPSRTGTYTLRWDLVEEGVAWFSGKGVPTFDQTVVVGPPPFYGGSIDAALTAPVMPTAMVTTVSLRVQNLSNFDFGADVNLAYHWYDAAGRAVVWDGLRTSLAGLKVNEVRALSALVAGPATPGAYTLRWDIVREGVAWFSAQGMQLPTLAVRIDVPAHGAVYTVGAAPSSGAAGAVITVPVTLANVGSVVWENVGFGLAYHLYDGAGRLVTWDGLRTSLGAALRNGQSVSLQAIVRLPPTPGLYTVRFDLVQEGLTWFSAQGVPMGTLALQVR